MMNALRVGRGKRLSFAILSAAVSVVGFSSAPAGAWEIDFDSELTLVQETPPSPATRLATTQGSRFSRSAEAEIRFQEGLFRYNNKRLEQAEADFKAVLADDPADTQAYYFLALSQLDQNRPADAVENFTQALRLDPTLEEVYAARARAYLRMGRWDEAEQDIAELRSPSFTGERHYLLGLLAYGRNDLETARNEFAAAKAAGGVEATPASFYEGLTYLKMRELVRARSAFRDATSIDPDRDPTLAAASRQLDAVLALEQRSTRPWEAQITIAYEYDSNVIQIGAQVPLPDGISNESDSRLVLQPRGSYSFIQTPKWEVGVEANGYFSFHYELDEFDIASYQAGPFVNYTVNENLYLSARYGYNYITLSGSDYLGRNVFTPQITIIEKNFGYTSAYYQFQTRQFDDPQSIGPLDRDGYSNSIGVVQGINLPSIFRDVAPAALELSYRLEDQAADGSDFDGLFHNLGVTLYTPLPFFKLRADAGLSFSYDDYDNGNSLDANGTARRDFEWNFSGGLTREINRNIAIRADYSYTDNDSNVQTAADEDPFSFDRWQVGLRLIITF